jgi:hypothetical protein
MQLTILGAPQRQAFPTLDFKFVNTGSVVAMMHRFHVLVDHAEIDRTPELDFSYAVVSESWKSERYAHLMGPGALAISVRNNGWGPARNLGVKLDFGPLNDVILLREFHATELTDDCAVVPIQIQPSDLHQDRIDEKMLNLQRDGVWHKFAESVFGGAGLIPINDVMAQWSALDITGATTSDRVQVGGPNHSRLLLSKLGFVIETHHVSYCLSAPQTRYCSILDAEEGPYRRSYQISRVIQPGQGDHFQIVVGCNKSARFKLRIAFSVNNNPDIESEAFDISIWNPRHKYFHAHYMDGDVSKLRKPDERDDAFPWSTPMDGSSDALKDFPFLSVDPADRW